MDDLERYRKSFSERGFCILESSAAETQRRGQYYIAPEHVLFALIKEEPDLFDQKMHKHSIDPNKLRAAVRNRLDNRQKRSEEGVQVSPEMTVIFKRSMDKARAEGRRTIDVSDICHIFATWEVDVLLDILEDA
jgi:ATP-dependent Clp protease ATP-binding subunit ClpA